MKMNNYCIFWRLYEEEKKEWESIHNFRYFFCEIFVKNAWSLFQEKFTPTRISLQKIKLECLRNLCFYQIVWIIAFLAGKALGIRKKGQTETICFCYIHSWQRIEIQMKKKKKNQPNSWCKWWWFAFSYWKIPFSFQFSFCILNAIMKMTHFLVHLLFYAVTSLYQ